MLKTEEEKKAPSNTRKSDDPHFNIKNMISSIMLAAVGAILVIVVMAYMTHIAFGTEIDWREQGANAVLLAVCSVAVTIILRSWGIMKGEENPERIKALAEVEKHIKEIESKRFGGRAAEYCRWWENDEYERTVTAYLDAFNLTLSQFKTMRIYDKKEIQSKYPALSKVQIDAVITAKKIKKLRYSESFMVTTSKQKEHRAAPSQGLSTEQSNAIMTAQNIITSILMSIVMVSFSVEVIADPSLATVVSCLLKVITILLSGLGGAYGGYNLTAKTERKRLENQAREQQSFIAYCEEHKIQPITQKEPEKENENVFEKPVDENKNGFKITPQSA